jgi:hypothetical protein
MVHLIVRSLLSKCCGIARYERVSLMSFLLKRRAPPSQRGYSQDWPLLGRLMYRSLVPNRTQIGQYTWKARIEICLHS